MSNVFDRFDGPTPAQPQAASSNVFDQFDAGAKPERKPTVLENIGTEIAERQATAREGMKEASSVFAAKQRRDSSGNLIPGEYDSTDPGSVIAGLMGMAGSGFSYLASPVSATAQALYGKPLEKVTGGAIPKTLVGDYVDLVAGQPWGAGKAPIPRAPEGILYEPIGTKPAPKKAAAKAVEPAEPVPATQVAQEPVVGPEVAPETVVSPPEAPTYTVKRAPDYKEFGTYDLDVDGKTYKFGYDADSRMWYEDGPGHHSERWIGFNKKEATEKLLERHAEAQKTEPTPITELAAPKSNVFDQFEESGRRPSYGGEQAPAVEPTRPEAMSPDSIAEYKNLRSAQEDAFFRGQEGDESAKALEKDLRGNIEAKFGHIPEEQLDAAWEGRLPEELAASRTAQLRAQPEFKAIEADDPLNLEPLEQSTYDMARDLNKALGLTHRQGRITNGQAAGIYKVQPGVVRTRAMHEMDVLSHEGGHALEYQNHPELLNALKTHEAEVSAMRYPGTPDGVERQEGFAEFFRWYLTHPEEAQKRAPNFYPAFEEAMAKEQPEVFAKLRSIQANHGALMRAPSASVAMSEVVPATPKGPIETEVASFKDKGPGAWVRDWADEAYYQFINRFHGVQMAVDRMLDLHEKATGKRLDIPTHEHPEKLLQMSAGARDAAMIDINEGVVPYHSVEPASASLKEAVETAVTRPGESQTAKMNPDRYHEFSTYLNARNMLAQWGRYEAGGREMPPSRHPPVVYAQAIKTLERGNPQFREAAQMVYDYGQQLWKLRRDAGFLTKEQYEEGLLLHPDYVPAMRDMSNPGGEVGSRVVQPIRGTGAGKSDGGVRQMRGSTRNVIDPIWAMAQQTMELRMLVARNDSVRALDSLAQKIAPGTPGMFVERIPNKTLKAMNFGMDEALQAAMKEREQKFGPMSEREELEFQQAAEMLTDVLGEDAKGKLFRATDINERGEPIVYYWENGKRGALQLADGKIGRMMLDGIANLNRPMQGIMINAASLPARWLRTLVVTHPKFWAGNIIRDQLTAPALTNVGYVPFYDWVKGMKAELGSEAAATRYKAAQGAMGGIQSAAERQVLQRRSLKSFSETGVDIRSLPEQIGVMSELSESGTRLGVFMKAEAAAKAKGLGDWESAVEGAHTATDMLNFNRRGAWKGMQAMLRMIPFLGANIQALDKAARVMFPSTLMRTIAGVAPRTAAEAEQMKLAGNAWMWAMGMATASAALRATYGDDPEYAEVNQKLRQTHWVIMNEKGEFVAIPKPFELAAPSALAERAVEGFLLKDETAGKHALDDMFGMLLPQVAAPPIIPMGLLTNKDYFNMDVVPEAKKDLLPQYQSSEYTSWLAEKAPLWGGNPAQTDYLERTLGGYWGQDVIKGIDRIMKDRPEMADNAPDMFFLSRFIRQTTRNSESSKKFWDKFEKMDPEANSLRELVVNQGDYDEAYKLLKKMKPDERVYAMVETFGQGNEKQMHPLTHTKKTFTAISKLTRDIQNGEVRLAPNAPPIELDAKQRREAFEAFRYLNMAQTHNALVHMEEPGFKNQKELPQMEAIQRLKAVDPRLDDLLNLYYRNDKVIPLDSAQNAWEQIKQRYEKMPTEAEFITMAERRRQQGSGAFERMLRPVAK